MYRIKIRIDTQSEVMKLVQLAEEMEEEITLEDDCGHCVNAKSLLGVMYGKVEFVNTYLRSNSDRMGNIFKEFMI